MDWQNERYVRVYTRTTSDLLAIGWEGRFVWYELLRHADRAGVIDTRGDLAVIPDLLRVPIDIFERGFPRIVERKMVEVVTSAIVLPNFLEAQEARKSDAQRQRESRAKRRAQSRHDEPENVTGRDTMESQDVTLTSRNSAECDETVTDVTPSLAVPSLTSVSVPAAQEPLTLPGVGSEKASKPKVIRWTGDKVRSDAETEKWSNRRFDDFAPDFVELCARLADSRKDGVAQTVLERFTHQLLGLAEENIAAFRYGVSQILELDSDFEYSGRPSKIVNYIKTCMKSYRPNGTPQSSRGRANSRGGGLDSADIMELARQAKEIDGQ